MALTTKIVSEYEPRVKNVLFLAPGYKYAQTVVKNLSSDLDRAKIPYNASTKPDNFYVRTDKVHVEIAYMDPVKWTPVVFTERDAVFGKKELVDKAYESYFRMLMKRPAVSLYKYIREAHIDPAVEEYPPREHYIPEIKNVYFNDPMTVVIWADGTKTMVKCQPGDVYSEEVGLALCIAKKSLGNMSNFNNVFRKWIPEDKEEPVHTHKASITGVISTDEAVKSLKTSLSNLVKGVMDDWSKK